MSTNLVENPRKPGRITPDEVIAAYAATGLIPGRTGEEWFSPDGCGCGLTAILKARNPEFCNPHWPTSLAAQELGVSLRYVHGFAHGFDGKTPDPARKADDFELGLSDGRAAASAVFGEVAL